MTSNSWISDDVDCRSLLNLFRAAAAGTALERCVGPGSRTLSVGGMPPQQAAEDAQRLVDQKR